MDELPPIRACIFDFDGLLIDSEDAITRAIDIVLSEHHCPNLPTHIRVQMMGVSQSTDGSLFHDWARLPREQRDRFSLRLRDEMRRQFECCKPLPGALTLLRRLSTAQNINGDRIELALASGTTQRSFDAKTSDPLVQQLMEFLPPENRILGSDPRLDASPPKPAPDIYLLALDMLRMKMQVGKSSHELKAEECLVFEDSKVGVEAARRAGMRVIWVPHADIATAWQGEHDQVLAGHTNSRQERENATQTVSCTSQWAQMTTSLEDFEPKSYGIQ